MPKTAKARKRYAKAILHREYIIQQIRAGRTVRDIAKELERTPGAISACLAHNPRYRSARRQAATNRVQSLKQAFHDANKQRPFVVPAKLDVNIRRIRKQYKLALAFAQSHFPLQFPSTHPIQYGCPDYEAAMIQRRKLGLIK